MNSKWLKLYYALLKGKLTRDDQHQIEREALDDPFLRDALEGIELYHGADRQALQARLEKRLKRETKPKVFKLWKYAAAASIVLVAGVFFFLKPDKSLSLDSNAYSQQIATPTSDDDLAIILAPEDISVKSIEDTAIYALISHSVQEVDLAGSKVDRIHPKREQLVKASDEAMVHVASNAPESDMGLSTQAIISAADHANSQLSDKLKTARGRANSSPAKMPIGSAESDDPMPVPESIEIVYIPNHQTEFGTDTFPKIEVSNIVMDDSLLLIDLERGMGGINGRLIDLVNSNESSPSTLLVENIDTIEPIIEPQTLDQFGERRDGYPMIGWAAFDSLLMTEMPDKVDMFMQGVKDGDWNRLRIMVDSTGKVTQFDSGAMPSDGVERALEKTGKWQTNKKSAIIIHNHKIFSKEKN